jgi:peroxiredoxin
MKYLLILLLTLLASCDNTPPPITTGLEGKAMPDFALLAADSTHYLNTKDIKTGHPTVLLYFGPYCPFSKAQVENITKDIDEFKNIQFLLISNYPLKSINQFAAKYQLNKYPNITVFQDHEHFFASYYQSRAVPYIAVYNQNKVLNQVFLGITATNILREVALRM